MRRSRRRDGPEGRPSSAATARPTPRARPISPHFVDQLRTSGTGRLLRHRRLIERREEELVALATHVACGQLASLGGHVEGQTGIFAPHADEDDVRAGHHRAGDLYGVGLALERRRFSWAPRGDEVATGDASVGRHDRVRAGQRFRRSDTVRWVRHAHLHHVRTLRHVARRLLPNDHCRECDAHHGGREDEPPSPADEPADLPHPHLGTVALSCRTVPPALSPDGSFPRPCYALRPGTVHDRGESGYHAPPHATSLPVHRQRLSCPACHRRALGRPGPSSWPGSIGRASGSWGRCSSATLPSR